jgi:hypothetical protein
MEKSTKEMDIFNKAGSLYEKGEYKKAERLFIKLKQDNFTTWQLGMFIYHKLEKHAFAINYALKLINEPEFDTHYKLIFDILGLSYIGLNQLDNAILYFEKSAAKNATLTNADTLFLLLKAYHQTFRVADVERLAPKFVHWTDYSVPAALLLIESAKRLSNKALLLKRVLAIIPECNYLSLLDFSRITNDMINLKEFDKAERFISVYEFKHLTPANDFTFKILRARLALANNQYNKVHTLLNIDAPDGINSFYYTQAKAYEKQGNVDKAFLFFQNGAAVNEEKFPRRKRVDKLNDLNSVVENFALKRQKESFTNQSPNSEHSVKHVFTFGFPRSGTTLLETILETQENTLSLSELPMLARTIQAFKIRLNKKYPQDLVTLTEKELNVLRKVYFDSVTDLGVEIPDFGVLIDKGPHNTQHLLLIKLLFPNAKLIISIRHPLAVCLSCFQQDFAANNNNIFLITLKDIVARYVQIFTLLESYQNKLGIECFIVKYEDLVDDLEGVVEQVFTYLGVQHDKSYLEFHKHASTKYVSSSSRGQTDQALYTGAKDNWKLYYKYLEPYVSDLQYFIDKYNYDVEC